MIAIALALVLAAHSGMDIHKENKAMDQQMFYRTVKVDGLSVFYREAGPKDAPTILLLHGLPSSSRMFQPLLTRLADTYHLVAPDYPGYGHSDWPDPKQFDYTFDHVASVMDHFTERLGLSHCKIMAGRSDFAWRWRIPSASRPLLSRMRSRTTKVWERIGQLAAPSGQTGRHV